MIDFERESETDKTAHMRKQLHALASVNNCRRSQMARFPPEPPPPPPPQKFNCPPDGGALAPALPHPLPHSPFENWLPISLLSNE